MEINSLPEKQGIEQAILYVHNVLGDRLIENKEEEVINLLHERGINFEIRVSEEFSNLFSQYDSWPILEYKGKNFYGIDKIREIIDMQE